MEFLSVFQQNFFSSVILAFILGFIAKLIKSDLQIPDQILKGISIYLLFSIGLKGGNSFLKTPLSEMFLPILLTLGFVLFMPFWTFLIAKKLGKLNSEDAAGVAAVYSSASSVTFITALSLAEKFGTPAESFLPSIVAVIELAIIVGLFVGKLDMGKKLGGKVHFKEILFDTLNGRSFILLVGGMIIGILIGNDGYESIKPLYSDLFNGILTFFLLEMGMVAAGEIKHFLKSSKFMFFYGTIMPVLHGILGTYLASLVGLSPGGAFVFGTIIASSSYIDAPVVVKSTFPNSNQGLYLTASLGLTFPFNLIIGMPIYYELAKIFAG
jgi:hypothetical protein